MIYFTYDLQKYSNQLIKFHFCEKKKMNIMILEQVLTMIHMKSSIFPVYEEKITIMTMSWWKKLICDNDER